MIKTLFILKLEADRILAQKKASDEAQKHNKLFKEHHELQKQHEKLKIDYDKKRISQVYVICI